MSPFCSGEIRSEEELSGDSGDTLSSEEVGDPPGMYSAASTTLKTPSLSCQDGSLGQAKARPLASP